MTAIDRILQSYRDAAVTEREKGTYFERLGLAFFLNDPVQAEEYETVWTWSEWAKANGRDGKDVGIDLVAKLRNEDGFAAIQAKFYAADTRIQKANIDSFISASGKEPFRRRVVLDTTEREWGTNAEEMIRDQAIPVVRIGLTDLRESRINWTIFEARGEIVLSAQKTLMPHQRDALADVSNGLAAADRGKMIMACGTGKTFTSLKIAEAIAGKGKRVLFMVPSLALMSQTVREWTNDTETPIRAFAVCSDAHVGKRRKSTDDIAEIEIHDLAFPATTDPVKVAEKAGADDPERMTVIFSTYQSIVTLTRAQEAGLPDFDLIICDEAHRTTGATLDGDEESNFVKIHSNDNVKARKRLYMTATPRIFGDNVRSKAEEVGADLVSMDDPALFGEILFHRGFGWAVQNGLLTDYKVIVLAMDEGLVSAAVQKRLGDAGSELVLDDATKIIGCYKALTKIDLRTDVAADPRPMHRAIAFAKDIRSSELIRDEFAAVVDEYLGQDSLIESDEPTGHLQCEIEHVDGTFNAKTRGALLDWLKADAGDNTCRILTNARCLSEGVDVPALDAIMFLHPRKSQIDVVQSVGRVMRTSEATGKKMGYVILPVGVPAGVPAEQALADNERYRVVWQILNALRAHDERFDSTINKMSLGQDISDTIEIVGITAESEELKSVTAVVQNLPNKTKAAGSGIGSGGGGNGDDVIEGPEPRQTEMAFSIDEFSRAIMAKIVKKCGTRDYWEDWSASIAEIAKNHITRLTALLKDPDTEARRAFDAFLGELRDDLNDTISEGDAIEMLAQHIITRPVFETLFEGHKFTAENPVSRAMQRVLDVLNEANLDKESKDLEKFYASVKIRSQGITDPQAKQKLIVELYDKFFRRAFPRTTEKLGIVYTPVEIVDFIIHSVNEVLQSEFGQTLGSPGVHIIDPFTGTGTFITRLLQSGLIAPEEMEHKFRHEIHANEIVLLAYYIAAINIEAVFHGLQGGEYVPFEGICLTDTFQMYESDDLISHYMPDNSERRKRQKATEIRVILGNPPYSKGQDSANDDNANVEYPTLDGRIRNTYAAMTEAQNKNGLYNSYLRAFRWASDRIGDGGGVVAFVTNGGWLDGNATTGVRRSFVNEFTDLYLFNLRGDAHLTGERRRKEKGNVFGAGTRTPITIAVLIRNPERQRLGQIHYHDIGDYLEEKEKLKIVRDFGSIAGIAQNEGWRPLEPDEHGDWLNQRDASFDQFIQIGDKKDKSAQTLFETYSRGVATGRDAWCYNRSHAGLERNITSLIDVYNREREKAQATGDAGNEVIAPVTDPKQISWSAGLLTAYERGRLIDVSCGALVQSLYRPFGREWLFYSAELNERRYQMPKIFPDPSTPNRVIAMSSPGARGTLSVLMTDRIPSLHAADMSGSQCFPLFIYGGGDEAEADLFSGTTDRTRRDGITDAGLKHFQAAYEGEEITKEDVFYYVYGLLHSEEYSARYADNLAKELPRIPRVKKIEDFRAFSTAGSNLADLHVNYESVEPYPTTFKQGDLRTWVFDDPAAFYRVTKMKFGGKRPKLDKSTVVYNTNITMQDIPLGAYDYVVNGKPALEWVMERQGVLKDSYNPKTQKGSDIVNDANRYATETVGNPAYPLELFQRVITVSLRTMEIVRGLPKLEVM